jgi:hypothetical protein
MQNETQSKIRLSTISPARKRKTLMVESQINGKSKHCIVDTGASISLVSKNEWQLLKGTNASLTPSDVVAEAANNSPIGILGKTALDVKFDTGHISCHEFYVASDMISEIIFGLDWLMSNKVNVDLSIMVLTFPDLSTKPLSVFDSTVSEPLAVVLSEDIECPAKHEIFQTARIRNRTISESVLGPNKDRQSEDRRTEGVNKEYDRENRGRTRDRQGDGEGFNRGTRGQNRDRKGFGNPDDLRRKERAGNDRRDERQWRENDTRATKRGRGFGRPGTRKRRKYG